MSNFRKKEACPASDRLLLFQIGAVSAAAEENAIRRHLGICEFCAAEVAFYADYPPVDESVEVERIPAALFELASALLKNDSSSSRLSREMEKLSDEFH